MLPVLSMGGPRLEVNALFIQPTRWCDLDCKGCYVKEHSGGEMGYHTPVEEQYKLFTKFFEGEEAWANQITIAIDNFPPDLGMTEPPSRLLGLPYNRAMMRRHMITLFHTVMTQLARDPNHHGPEVHMTFNSDQVLKEYLHAVNWSDNNAGLLSVVSLSHIKNIEYVKDLAKHTHINYNHLVPGNVTSFNIDKHVERMTRIGEVVDSIYMVIFKSPVGRERSDIVEIGDRSRMLSDLSYIRTMMERLPEHVRRKIHVDGCVKDTAKFLKTGFGCSSNVSRFQVWPDGSVSGCPYAFSADGGVTGKTAEDIMDNIRAARSRYDFKERCHLPSVYNSIRR